MKKFAFIAMVLMAATGAWAGATSGDATAHLFVDVNPTIAVGVDAGSAHVDLGTMTTGDQSAVAIFTIHANLESVNIQVMATDLFKGDVYSSPYKILLKRAAEDGALVEPDNGNAMDGHGNMLGWEPSPSVDTIDGMTLWQTEIWAFESGSNGNFSQDVTVTVEYTNSDDELPQGEYSGYMKIVASIGP